MHSGRYGQQGSAEGSWMLIDMINPNSYSLVSVGGESKPGLSLRKSLSELTRELILERVKQVGEHGKPLDENVEHRGQKWRVKVRPLISPVNRVVVGVQAIFVKATSPIPERPLAGTLEWRIIDGGRVIETDWDDDMFAIYGARRTGLGSAAGNMTDWVGTLVAPEDRARMKVVITGGISAPDGQRHVIAYRINAGDDGTTKYLEASGRVTHDPDGHTKWLRGITREVEEMAPAKHPAVADMASGALLRAAFDLNRETVMLAIDTEWWQIFMTNAAWAVNRLQMPHYGYVPHAVHPDDMDEFMTLCDTAGASQPPATIRFLCTDGNYAAFTASVSSGRFGDSGDRRYVIASLAQPKSGDPA